MFFCCDVCALQFRGLLDRLLAATGWPSVDGLEIVGDRRGRTVTARHADHRFRCFIAFNSEGLVRTFEPRASD